MAKDLVSSSEGTDNEMFSELEDKLAAVVTALRKSLSSDTASPSTSSSCSASSLETSSSVIKQRKLPQAQPLGLLLKQHFENKPFRNLFMEALVDGDIDNLKAWLNAGMDVNFKSGDLTPLMFAASVADCSIVSLLLERGADVNSRTQRGNSALHFACSDHDGQCLSVLIDAGANTSYMNSQGNTALHYAASASEACVRALIDAGADRSVRNEDGETPYSLAKTDAVRDLLRP